MNQLWAFVRKEIYHITRDRKTLLILFGLPIVQILLFGFALSNEVKNTTVYMCNMSKDELSMRLQSQIHASKYFDIVGSTDNPGDSDEILRSGKAKLVIIIPAELSQDLNHQKATTISTPLNVKIQTATGNW